MSIFEEERNKSDFRGRLEEELAWVRAAREAVRDGSLGYGALLADPAPLIRAGAAYLLGHFHEDAERNIALIRGHVSAGEGHEVVRAACVLSVGLLATAHEEATAWLELVLAADEPDAVRIAAGLGLGWSMRKAIPPAAQALLVKTAGAPGAAKATFEQFPWDALDIQTYCTEALAVVAGEPAQRP